VHRKISGGGAYRPFKMLVAPPHFLIIMLMRDEHKTFNRWWVAVGGFFLQMCLGSIYAWSAFTGPLTDPAQLYSFTKTQTQIIFSFALLMFAVVMALVAGRWQKEVGPKIVAMTGGLFLGLGYFLAGISGASFLGIFLGWGLIGAGIGLGYVCPIAALVRWFPDKKGLMTGLAVAGFGFGALIWVKLTTGFRFGPIDLTPGWKGLYGMGWTVNDVFLLYSAIMVTIVWISALVLVYPPDSWSPPGWSPPPSTTPATGSVEFTPTEMVRTAQFWKLFFNFLVGATAGLMVIGVIQLFASEALSARGVPKDETLMITSTAMGLFLAIFNGVGRIAWGSISDWLGRKLALVTMTACQGIVLLGFYLLAGWEIPLYIFSALVGFNFGGNFALFPAITADYFGNRSVGTNYPWLFLAYGLGGVIGPILGGMMGDYKQWFVAFCITGIACLISAAITATLKPPRKTISQNR